MGVEKHLVLTQAFQSGVILFCQPGWGRGRGGIEDHPHSLFLGKCEKFVEELIGIFSFPGLDQTLGEFSDADASKSRFQHPVQIFLPEGFVPVLRVVADTQINAFSVN